MKKLSYLVLVVALAAGTVFSSCKKDKPEPNVNTQIPQNCMMTAVKEDGKQTTGVVYTMDNKIDRVNSYDANGVIEGYMQPTYDANKRITRIAQMQDGSEMSHANIYYNVSNMPGRAEFIATGEDGQEMKVLEMTFEYNANQFISKQTTTSYWNGMPQSTTHVTYDYDANGNVSKETSYTNDNRIQGTTEYLYDDKKNPYKALGLPVVFGPAQSNNNPVTVTEKDANGNIKSTTNNTYEYNASNYPVKIKSGTSSSTTEIEYNCK